MGDFSQNGIISTLHDFGTKSTSEIEKDLLKFSKERKMELILPCLYSELEGSALPKIVDEISKTKYLDHIIVGLDKANEIQAKKAWKFFKKLKTPFSLLWNDGPALKKLDKELKKKDLAPNELGKGRNVWYCMGYTLAVNAVEAVALHDCDIVTYDRSLLARLIYPVANPNFRFQFSKGYYSRIAGKYLGGRVSRLLVTPLTRAFKQTLASQKTDYLEFIDSFRYPLAGEFAMRKDVMAGLRIPSDWGLEIGVLIEMLRNFRPKRISQVDIADIYDHKHQSVSQDNDQAGLSKMSIDIGKAFFRALATDGVIFDKGLLRTLKATYLRVALDLVDSYRCDAVMNGLDYEVHVEEEMVELFAENLLKAGDTFMENPMETPFISHWNRVVSAVPDIYARLKAAVDADNARQLDLG